MEFFGLLYFGVTSGYEQLIDMSMIIISANLPTVQLYLPGPLFTPLRIAKKGFLAIISKTVQNIDLGP